MARKLTENNDRFYGYKRKSSKVKNNVAGMDLEFESVNPYEFKKGMYTELEKLGTTLRESEEEHREKATETVLKNLKDVPAYYSYMEHYETVTRNMDRKPSFKTFLKELEGHSMKEVTEKFTEDKMKEVKLKESIRDEVRNKINEILKLENTEEEEISKSAERDLKLTLTYIDKINTKEEWEALLDAIITHAVSDKKVTGLSSDTTVRAILLDAIKGLKDKLEKVPNKKD